MAAGMSDERLTHAHSIENAAKATSDLQTLLNEFLLQYNK
jgi:purine nucleoside phosphorylase